MDFAGVLDTVSRFLDSRGFRYALVGAFALSAHGLSRATQDLDLAVDAGARRDLVSLFESLGYETLYCSEGYSNHVHPLSGLGRVDCIYVAEPTATSLFESATAAPIFGRPIRVPKPAHEQTGGQRTEAGDKIEGSKCAPALCVGIKVCHQCALR